MDAALRDKVRAAKVLVVGAGGIGCELLKNLVLTGFRALTVIDLDTIDVSNLNRQFLFRPQHVGRSKALCAAEMVATFAPGVAVTAHHANIKEERFGVPFVAGFDLVINALDNMDARRHVNRLCLAADRPLIEAGTAGYLGQAQTILKGRSACIECVPMPPPRTFPICTIRSTPDRPVHCVVWGKELHKLLLGNAKESYLYDGATGPAPGGAGAGGAEEAAAEAAAVAAVPATYMPAVQALPALEQAPQALAAAAEAYARGVFQAIFHDDIARRLAAAPETYKGARVAPTPLDLARCLAGEYDAPAAAASAAAAVEAAAAAPGAAAPAPAPAPAPDASLLPEQRVLTTAASAELFLRTLAALVADPSARAAFGATEFSKDSPPCLDLVTSAANLRAAVFGIHPLQSRWAVKAIAGAIIPAIATTNAAVAGLQVLEALKLLSASSAGSAGAAAGSHTYVVRELAGGRKASLLLATALSRPSPHCPACSTPSLTLHLRDASALTLGQLVDGVLKGALGFGAPCLDNGSGLCACEVNLDEEEEGEFAAGWAALRALPLAALPGGGVRHGAILGITEMAPGREVRLNLTVLEGAAGAGGGAGSAGSAGSGEGWELRGVRAPMPPPLPPPQQEEAPQPAAAGAGSAGARGGKKREREEEGAAGAGEEEDVVVVVEAGEEGAGAGAAGGEEEGGGRAKRARTGGEGAGAGSTGAAAAEEEDEVLLVE